MFGSIVDHKIQTNDKEEFVNKIQNLIVGNAEEDIILEALLESMDDSIISADENFGDLKDQVKHFDEFLYSFATLGESDITATTVFSEEEISNLRTAFQVYDSDGDGLLEFKELEALVTSLAGKKF